MIVSGRKVVFDPNLPRAKVRIIHLDGEASRRASEALQATIVAAVTKAQEEVPRFPGRFR